MRECPGELQGNILLEHLTIQQRRTFGSIIPYLPTLCYWPFPCCVDCQLISFNVARMIRMSFDPLKAGLDL